MFKGGESSAESVCDSAAFRIGVRKTADPELRVCATTGHHNRTIWNARCSVPGGLAKTAVNGVGAGTPTSRIW